MCATEQTDIPAKPYNTEKRNKTEMKIKAFAAVILSATLCLAASACGGKKQTARGSSSAGASSEIVYQSEFSSEEKRLTVSFPENRNFTTENETVVFKGTSDPGQPLLCNGEPVVRGNDGGFSFEVKLNIGKNAFLFEHKGDTAEYNITYRYVVLRSWSPSKAQSYESGAAVTVTSKARRGAQVKAAFNGTVENLIEKPGGNGEFADYSAVLRMPDAPEKDLSLGKIVFTGTYNGITETFSSGNITVKKFTIVKKSDPSATPAGGYIDVGSGMIAEVVNDFAETNDGHIADYRSHPTNSFLPRGTVDYCKPASERSENGDDYLLLRCGRRVMSRRKLSTGGKGSVQLAKQYEGKLPDHNEISVVGFSNGLPSTEQQSSHSVLTLKPTWKAPFLLSLLPQNYTNPPTQDYTIEAQTFQYVEIKFYYATVFTGDVVIPPDNPLFSRAEIIRGGSDTVLRLYLKRTGKFFGWDCRYDSAGQLVFEFLNPAKITADTGNKYGVNLKNVRIMLDVGHGGADPGAGPVKKGLPGEANRNLFLAQKIQRELQTTGATVIMNRTDNNTTVDSENRRMILKRTAPDFCLAIHHDSNVSSKLKGFGAYYYYAFSKDAAKYVFEHTKATGIYTAANSGNDRTVLKWHYYYVGRLPTCPQVLTENGYMSNSSDSVGINDSAVNDRKAEALVRGIVMYFQSIQ